MFEKIKYWFETGRWTENMVKNAVIKGVLSKEESKEILKGK